MPHTTAQRTHAVRSGGIDGRRIYELSPYDADLHGRPPAVVPGDCCRACFSITVERTP